MMKKSIFAIAVASALTLGAAQAETVLYGSIRYDYENKKTSHLVRHDAYTIDADGNYVRDGYRYGFTSKRLSNLEDAGSRIGVKGSEDLGNNNAVIYNIELGFNGMSQNGTSGNHIRKAYMGITGDWGTFLAGRQDNPFWQTLVEDSVVDAFNGSSVVTSASQRAMTSAIAGTGLAHVTDYYLAGQAFTPENYVYSDINDDINKAAFSRVGKVAAYVTPNIAGFQASLAIMMDSDLYRELGYNQRRIEGHNQQKTLDLWTLNASYTYDLGANGSILAKAGYLNSKLADNNSSKMWGLFLGYISDQVSVTGSYASGSHAPQNMGTNSWVDSSGFTHTSYTDGRKNKYKGWDIGASYSFGANYFSTIRATYGQNEIKQNSVGNHYFDNYQAGGKDKVKSWAVGFEQKLSTRTRAWVEYGSEETKYNSYLIDKKKNDVISVGMRHDF